uniref:Uncharacterized protein n=1 Tax=Astyanax mexicanus TaxID=7994 RepID=A0A8B9R511_ASTMX
LSFCFNSKSNNTHIFNYSKHVLISAVRAVVPNKSNNEIVLVLQHFENCVDRAVQAFVEGTPKKKKKPKPQPEAPVNPAPSKSGPPNQAAAVNGFHANGSAGADGESLDSLSEQLDSASLDATELESEPATPDLTPSPAPQQGTNNGARHHQHNSRGNKSRHRPSTSSQNSTGFPSLPSDDGQQGSSAGKKIGKSAFIIKVL